MPLVPDTTAMPASTFWQPRWPVPPHVKSVCTTRAGGVSQAPYTALNLGSHVGDDAQHVQQNRKLLQQALVAHPVFLDQVHGTRIVRLSGTTPHGTQADGATTQVPGLVCTVMVADCLPILLCNRQGTQVAAVHAGWRGLADGVLEAAVQAMQPSSAADFNAADILAWLGPCIGPQAFEVGDEVRAAFMQHSPAAARCFKPHGAHKWLADLGALAQQRLKLLGITLIYGNDGSPSWCTVTNATTFFSHRRDRISGRQAACIWLV